MNRVEQAEMRRLRRIEKAARAVVDGIGAEDCERAGWLRREFPGSCGNYVISNARLDDLARAVLPPTVAARLLQEEQ